MADKFACTHCGFVFEDPDMEVCPRCGTELGQEWDPVVLRSFVITELTEEQAKFVATLTASTAEEILATFQSDGCFALENLTPRQVEAYAGILKQEGIPFVAESEEQKAIRLQKQLEAHTASKNAEAEMIKAQAIENLRKQAEAEAQTAASAALLEEKEILIHEEAQKEAQRLFEEMKQKDENEKQKNKFDAEKEMKKAENGKQKVNVEETEKAPKDISVNVTNIPPFLELIESHAFQVKWKVNDGEFVEKGQKICNILGVYSADQVRQVRKHANNEFKTEGDELKAEIKEAFWDMKEAFGEIKNAAIWDVEKASAKIKNENEIIIFSKSLKSEHNGFIHFEPSKECYQTEESIAIIHPLSDEKSTPYIMRNRLIGMIKRTLFCSVTLFIFCFTLQIYSSMFKYVGVSGSINCAMISVVIAVILHFIFWKKLFLWLKGKIKPDRLIKYAKYSLAVSIVVLILCVTIYWGVEASISFCVHQIQEHRFPQSAEWKINNTVAIELPHGGGYLELMPCPAGSFMMGSPTDEDGRTNNEDQHHVSLTKPFLIGKYEVTQEQYQAVMGKNPSYFPSQDRPVEQVNWYEAMAFCDELNEITKGKRPKGYQFTLPTEAQWEYACRAGTSTSLNSGRNMRTIGENNAPAMDKVGWYSGNCGQDFQCSQYEDISLWKEKQYDNSRGGSHPVGQKTPNAWGIYDMHGNVWEWCRDWYSNNYGGDATDPTGPSNGSKRVWRGGAWIYEAKSCRSACRGYSLPSDRYWYIGFRVVLSAIR